MFHSKIQVNTKSKQEVTLTDNIEPSFIVDFFLLHLTRIIFGTVSGFSCTKTYPRISVIYRPPPPPYRTKYDLI